ncbi:caM kinase-like vesicle-associated protein, partial [Plectropomus leopardus]|uniref:caM kinase-like vesicle-associated protein n=1 Tax=Plectropomus leopardus TaxID=160734 RepID=UPI001C4D95A7
FVSALFCRPADCVLFLRLCGFEPFFDPRGDQYMYSRILNCDYEFVSPWWDDVSLNAKDLVSKLIVLDPHKRLSVREALQHPWVLGKAARFSHMDTAQRKLQEFNARRKLKAAMKAVVATSRMHEGSRRRTDSCEIPGSGASRQSSMQQDPPPDAARPAPADKQDPPQEQQQDSKPADRSSVSPSPPCSPNPPSSDITPTGPAPTRPPLRADGLRQPSVVPKTAPVQPRPPQKSCSAIEPASRVEAAPTLTTPPSPNSLSNGFTTGAEPARASTNIPNTLHTSPQRPPQNYLKNTNLRWPGQTEQDGSLREHTQKNLQHSQMRTFYTTLLHDTVL